MLDELALDVLPGDRRAVVLTHLEGCPNCQRLLDQLSETADSLLLAGPVVAPPPGFDDRVQARIGDARGRGRRGRAQIRLPAFAAAAAAAALLAIGGIAGASMGGSAGGDGDGGRRFRTVDLISTTGADIGDVSTYYGRSAWYFMQLEGALPDGTYQCVLEMDDGGTVPLGRLRAVDGQGGWGDRVSVDSRRAKIARLVDNRGNTVATARLV
jgi:hypothetical protein